MEKERITFADFQEKFNKANEDNTKLYGVVVYSQKNWEKEYPLESRSYVTWSNQWGWDYSKMGHCRMGYALDGSEGIRMDYYDWEVDYCYLITEDEFKEIAKKYY